MPEIDTLLNVTVVSGDGATTTFVPAGVLALPPVVTRLNTVNVTLMVWEEIEPVAASSMIPLYVPAARPRMSTETVRI